MKLLKKISFTEMVIFVSIIFSIIVSDLLFVSVSHADNVTMGWEDWRPYQYKEDSGTISGLDVDIVNATFDNIGLEVKLVELPWKRHLDNVEKGLTDLAASASKTPEREVYSHFSDPYRNETVSMFIRKEDQGKFDFENLADIIGSTFRLAVTRGYYYGEEFEVLKNNPDFNKHIEEVNDNQLAQRQLIKKRVDGFLEDPIAANIELRIEGIQEEVIEHMQIYSDDIYVMFSKKSTDPELVAQFNKSLAEIRNNGTYQSIIDKYLK